MASSRGRYRPIPAVDARQAKPGGCFSCNPNGLCGGLKNTCPTPFILGVGELARPAKETQAMSDPSSGARKRSKELIDHRVHLQILRAVLLRQRAPSKRSNASRKRRGAPLKEVVAEVRSVTGVLASEPTLSRLQNGQYVRPIYGLRETAIRCMFERRIPRRAQMEELKLRQLHFLGKDLQLALVEAQEAVQELHEQLASAKAQQNYTEEEYKIARAAVFSLAQHVAIYRLDLAANADIRRPYADEAFQHGEAAVAELEEEIGRRAESESLAIPMLATRALVNNFYASYAIDACCGDVNTLPRARAFAERHGKPTVFTAVFRSAELTQDPRLAHNFAELAILLRARGPIATVETANLASCHPHADPRVTAARLLVLAKELDLAADRPIRQWRPTWLDTPLPMLEEARAVVERWELGLAQRTGLEKGSR